MNEVLTSVREGLVTAWGAVKPFLVHVAVNWKVYLPTVLVVGAALQEQYHFLPDKLVAVIAVAAGALGIGMHHDFKGEGATPPAT